MQKLLSYFFDRECKPGKGGKRRKRCERKNSYKGPGGYCAGYHLIVSVTNH